MQREMAIQEHSQKEDITSQRRRYHGKPNISTFWSWTFSLLNCEKPMPIVEDPQVFVMAVPANKYTLHYNTGQV